MTDTPKQGKFEREFSQRNLDKCLTELNLIGAARELQRAYDHIEKLEHIKQVDAEYIARSQENDERLCARIAKLEALKAKADALFKRMNEIEFATLWTGQVKEYLAAAKEVE